MARVIHDIGEFFDVLDVGSRFWYLTSQSPQDQSVILKMPVRIEEAHLREGAWTISMQKLSLADGSAVGEPRELSVEVLVASDQGVFRREKDTQDHLAEQRLLRASGTELRAEEMAGRPRL